MKRVQQNNSKSKRADKGFSSKTVLAIIGVLVLAILIRVVIFKPVDVAPDSPVESDPVIVSEGGGASGQQLPPVTTLDGNGEGVGNKSDTHNQDDQVFEQELQQKAAKLATQDHYNHNVEQAGREGVFNRTSYYDKPIGYIESKKVHISETIYAGASELNMRRGVATVEYQEQLNEQTVAIAGHRSPNRTQYLTGALYLKRGDEVTVTEYKEGTTEPKAVTTYVVDSTFTVTPSDVYVLEPDNSRGKRKLVLITCYKYNPETGLYDERFIVNAYEK